MTGKLYLCPTPIGNLDDMTFRTVKVLNAVDVICAEDTRRTVKLLNHFEIQKHLISYHEHNKDKKGPMLIDKLLNGENIALVSDAGMPGISDPGEDLVRLAIESSIDIEVLPGASAFIIALIASGIETSKFVFEGFLNRSKKERRKELEDLRYEKRTMIFYESPHRIKEMLLDMQNILGDRKICLARELTKKHEEHLRGSVSEIHAILSSREIKGEFVIIVEGSDEEPQGESLDGLSVEELVVRYMESGLSKKDSIKKAAKERGLAKNDVYQKVLDI